MSHLTFEELYRLAELTNDEYPYNEYELEEMRHLSICKECYKQFCSIAAVLAVTEGSGYIELANIKTVDSVPSKIEELSNHISAVVSIVFQKVRNSLSVAMRQIEQIENGFLFEAPLAAGARGVEDHSNNLVKLEDVENDRNFIVVDPNTKELLLQIDIRDIKNRTIIAYIITESGERIDIPIEQQGTIIKGKISQIPEESIKLYIET